VTYRVVHNSAHTSFTALYVPRGGKPGAGDAHKLSALVGRCA